MKESSLYIHIPYCASKCIYCDFFSGGIRQADWNGLTDALISELSNRKRELETTPDTLYIGGGTPSLIPADCLSRLVVSVNRIVNLEGFWKEFTIEVNPDDVTEEKCRLWKSVGVNRVSMGMQTFNDHELRAIRRRHDSATALKAYECLQKHFSNISVDLMFGIPGQTLESWEETVDKVISLRPQHLSAYSLMLEEGTPLTTLYNQGKIILPDDEENEAMWRLLSSRLGNAGYDQYEISNYSLPGFRSVHNSRYWMGNPYLGLGPSAHSYDGINIRRHNPSDIKSYISHYAYDKGADMPVKPGGRRFFEEEHLSKEEIIEERILTSMRIKEGIDLKLFGTDFGDEHLNQLLRNAYPLEASGYIKIAGSSLSLTSLGVMLSDRIILALSMF